MCAFLADAEHAEVLYRELEPFAGLTIMVVYPVCLGPADTLLGALAALLGRVDQAAAHFRAALDVARRSGSPVWVAGVGRRRGTDLPANPGGRRGSVAVRRGIAAPRSLNRDRSELLDLHDHVSWDPQPGRSVSNGIGVGCLERPRVRAPDGASLTEVGEGRRLL